MEKKDHEVSVTTVIIQDRKFLCIDDLLMSLYAVKDSGYNILVVSDLINSLKDLKEIK